MYQPKIYPLYLLLLLLLFTPPAKAQRLDSLTYSPNTVYYWGGFHVGAGSYLVSAGFDGGMLLRNTFIVGAKIDRSANLSLFGSPNRTLTANEYAFLLGLKLTQERISNWVLLSGISAVRMADRGEPIDNRPGLFGGNVYGDDKVYHGAGVPVILKYTVTPSNFVALDFAAAVNINSYRGFFMLTFGLTFGKVRNSSPDDRLPQRDQFNRQPGLFPPLPY